MIRRLLLASLVTSCLFSGVAVSATPPLVVRGPVHLTAAGNKGLSAVMGTFVNTTKRSVLIYRVTSDVANPAMLHYDVNMCDKGQRMNTLPVVVVPPGGTIKLTTKGLGAMLFPLKRSLHRGDHVMLMVKYRWKKSVSMLHIVATVVRAPKGLIHSKRSSVG